MKNEVTSQEKGACPSVLEQAIDKALEFAANERIQWSEQALRVWQDRENPKHTVAIVGPFQVGKSTLINKVFLGDTPLLQIGDGRCATAVTTKVVAGSEKKATVFYRDDSQAPRIFQGNEVDDALLAELTVVDETDETLRQEKRVELARSIRYIELELPSTTLGNYAIYDTPGVDDPNQELIDLTTREFLPEADLVVVVAPGAKQLDVYTKQFLSRAVFENGRARLLLLLACRAQDGLAGDKRAAIVDAIQGELAQMGREYVPVCPYAFDDSVEGEVLRGAEEIGAAITEFIERNKRLGREERLAAALCADLNRMRNELIARFEVSALGEKEREELVKKIEQTAKQLDARYQKTLSDSAIKAASVKKWALDEIDERVLNQESPDSAVSLFLRRFDACDSLKKVRDEIEPAVQFIKTELEYILSEIGEQTSRKLTAIAQDVASEAEETSRTVRVNPTAWSGDDVDGGMCAKINPIFVRGAEALVGFLVFNVLGALAVVLAGHIPGLKNLLPVNFLAHKVKRALADSFVQSVGSVKQEFTLHFDGATKIIEEETRDAFQTIYNANVAPYLQALEEMEKRGAVLSEDEAEALRRKIQEYENALKDLALALER